MARYNLEEAKRTFSLDALSNRPLNIWRYKELLPVQRDENMISMGEGWTPLIKLQNVSKELGLNNLYLKDEGLCPTGSFKARGAAVCVSKLLEWGVKSIGIPTAGNAGGALACYGARAGIEVHIAMPEDAPQSTWKQAVAAGAKVYLIEGEFDESLRFMTKAMEKFGWYNASTYKEPWRIEGKKTMGFEIFEQFENSVPDAIIYPTGGGVGLIAIWKAFKELERMGLLEPGWRCRLISVQTAGCFRLKLALDQGAIDTEPWEGPMNTAIPGMSGPRYTIGDHLALKAIRDTGGDVSVVDDGEILQAMHELASVEGIFACPEGAATFAAARKLRDAGSLQDNEKIVLLNTGSGLKYQEFIKNDGTFSGQESLEFLQ